MSYDFPRKEGMGEGNEIIMLLRHEVRGGRKKVLLPSPCP